MQKNIFQVWALLSKISFEVRQQFGTFWRRRFYTHPSEFFSGPREIKQLNYKKTVNLIIPG